MTYLKKILLTLIFILGLHFILGESTLLASGTIEIPGSKTAIEKSSATFETSTDISGTVNNVAFRILSIIKYILYAVLIGMIVYTGFTMIHSMGRDEEALTKAKNQLWYFVVAMVFINVPSVIVNTIYNNGKGSLGSETSDFNNVTSKDNLIFNFESGLVENIISILQITVYAVAFAMFIYGGIRLITSRGQEEKMKEAKNKIVYSILALVFAGIIDTWKRVAYSGSVDEGRNLFESMANLALFFAAPVTLFFLGLAAYYMVTANGDEEKVKKSKTIILSTCFGVFILLSSYVLLMQVQGIDFL